MVNLKNNHLLLEKSSEWKLPPNIYNFCNSPKTQAGKKGPYKCFTVERIEKTIKNHFSVKSEKDCCKTDFYELPTFTCLPNNKFKFLKSPRFKTNNCAPKSCILTKKFPLQNVSKRKRNQTLLNGNPVFFYSLTTVPVKEMSFNKENFVGPDPSRYTSRNYKATALTHDLLKNENKKSFHDKDFVALISDEAKEIRYNTMVKKRNVFGLKTGRPSAFLSASPRFKDEKEKTIQLYEKSKKKLFPSLVVWPSEVNNIKKFGTRLSKRRLEQLAAPKGPLQKISVQKIQVFTKNPLSIEKKINVEEE